MLLASTLRHCIQKFLGLCIAVWVSITRWTETQPTISRVVVTRHELGPTSAHSAL